MIPKRRKLLDPVIEHMCESVEKYGGTVSRVMGDGILALFGAPVSWEDHAVRACHAALSMQDLVRHYGDDIQRVWCAGQIRIGLSSGEVVLNVSGRGLYMSYIAVGGTCTSRHGWSRWRSPARCSRRRRPSGWPRDTSRRA